MQPSLAMLLSVAVLGSTVTSVRVCTRVGSAEVPEEWEIAGSVVGRAENTSIIEARLVIERPSVA